MSLSIPRCALTALTLALLSLAAPLDAQAAEPTAVGGASMLVGDAADSPLTKKKTTPFVASTVNYSF